MRRHWQLVCCAFSFCWYHQAHAPAAEPLTAPVQPAPPAQREQEETMGEEKAGGKKGAPRLRTTAGVLAQSLTSGQSLARTLGLAPTILAGVVATAPTPSAPAAP
jgi:hypothetical protein